MLENHVATRRACAHRRVAATVLAAVLWMGACQDPVRPSTPPPTRGPARTLVAATVALQPWELENPATNHEIEGYASATSVNAGESIQLFVNTSSPTYAVSVYRMGWYGGAGAQLVYGPVTQAGTAQAAPNVDITTGLVECAWTNPVTVATASWKSGVYLAKLTASSGKSSYIIFVVREDGRSSALLVQLPVNTWQAYNTWGGASLYVNDLGNPAFPYNHAFKVSLNRPYANWSAPNSAKGIGAGEFLTTSVGNGAGWDYNMVRYLERLGYDVTYTTDYDVHKAPASLLTHSGLLVIGHDEYWTMPQRNGILAARDRGINLGFFGANIGYWQVRFEPAKWNGGAIDRTMVGYKEYSWNLDPIQDSTNTTQFRMLSPARPENRIIGVMYDAYYALDRDITITDTSTYATAGVPLGAVLPGLNGSEVDAMTVGGVTYTVNASHKSIAHAYFADYNIYSDVSLYTADRSGAQVFATGSYQWSWGLDDYNSPDLRTSRLSTAAQTITKNVLQRLAAAPPPPPPTSVAAVVVTLTPSSVPAGSTSQATAKLLDANRNVLAGRTVAWSLGVTNDAKISTTGLVTTVGSKPSSVVVTATSEGRSASATLTITSRK